MLCTAKKKKLSIFFVVFLRMLTIEYWSIGFVRTGPIGVPAAYTLI